jgi:hypothetical protein
MAYDDLVLEPEKEPQEKHWFPHREDFSVDATDIGSV